MLTIGTKATYMKTKTTETTPKKKRTIKSYGDTKWKAWEDKGYRQWDDIEVPNINDWNKGQRTHINWWKVILLTMFFGVLAGMIFTPVDTILGICQ